MLEPKKPKTFGPKDQSPEIDDNKVENQNEIDGDEKYKTDDNSFDEGIGVNLLWLDCVLK